MKSVVFDEYGSPGRVLRIEERPIPEPGPGQVRVRMLLSPIHNHDLMIVTGHYGYKPPLPHVPGTEALGIVDKLGEGVGTLKVGQRVTGGASAAWAEYYVASAQSLVPLPDGIDDGTACQLVSMPVSAFRTSDQSARLSRPRYRDPTTASAVSRRARNVGISSGECVKSQSRVTNRL